MKSKFNLSIIIILLIVTGCSESFLDNPPKGSFSEDVFYKTEDAGIKSVIGCYTPMLNHWDYQVMWYDVGNIITDDSNKGGSDAGDGIRKTEVGIGKPLPTNAMLNSLWAHRFNAIGTCNTALENITMETPLIHKGGTYVSDAEKARYIAEIKFLRGFYYYDLVTVFGGVPLITKTLSPEEKSTLTKASVEEIKTQILNDVKACIDEPNMPTSASLPEAEFGRITRDIANAFKARVHLFFGDYADAKDASWKVIETGTFELQSDYQELFNSYGNGFFSKESVFTILREYRPGYTGSSVIPQMNTGRNNLGGWGGDCPTPDLVDEYEVGDARLIHTVIQDQDEFMKNDGTIEVHNYTGYDNNTGYHSRKAYVPHQRRPDGGFWQVDWTFYLIRYSDVLLMYAESLLETGGDKQEVADYINMVRKRAFVTTSRVDSWAHKRQIVIPEVTEAEFEANYAVKATDDLSAAIKHERRVELGMEGLRYYDLIRWDDFVSTMNAFSKLPYANGKGSKVDDLTWPYPIPQTEIDRTGGSITQNPGYN
ncbi:RagB/SusD family nutrient uptake outer membrane protein [Maribellus luteus]|uniref:RagB/SusD family nutrient uptake outer membrane protein n=1 Tax=Maribellus luteus TaxID=2305463 RepID=A0A399T2F2_9BACT|nr:RagB/SusD family nutrient uptake outer membrane protein [Maribellus luteus]RIJ48133.1 RagB/SusD family nutrient uptake outer membrane protein [Maribellus luteus]